MLCSYALTSAGSFLEWYYGNFHGVFKTPDDSSDSSSTASAAAIAGDAVKRKRVESTTQPPTEVAHVTWSSATENQHVEYQLPAAVVQTAPDIVAQHAPAASSLAVPATLVSAPATLPLWPPSRIVLTENAAQCMLLLHTGERELLHPLDYGDISDLVSRVQAAALERFGFPLQLNIAVTALEVSRQMSGASGFPQLEEALSCLRIVPGSHAALLTPPPSVPFQTQPTAAAQVTSATERVPTSLTDPRFPRGTGREALPMALARARALAQQRYVNRQQSEIELGIELRARAQQRHARSMTETDEWEFGDPFSPNTLRGHPDTFNNPLNTTISRDQEIRDNTMTAVVTLSQIENFGTCAVCQVHVTRHTPHVT